MLTAIITLFNPQPAHLANIRKLVGSPGLDHIILVQNSIEALLELNGPGITLIKNNNKGGIAGAFNRGAFTAFQNGADAIVLLDQDSEVPAQFFADMIQFMNFHQAEIAVPDFIDVNSRTRGIYFRYGFWKSEKQRELTNFVISNVAISSGSFISKMAFKKVGSFREDFIIDHVDTDFNFRAYLCGINIYVNRDIILTHAIGNRTKHKLFGIIPLRPTHHSPRRRYYRTRNGIILALQHLSDSPSYAWLILKWNIHDFLGIIFYEDQKWTKIMAIFRGVKDAFTKKMGAIS